MMQSPSMTAVELLRIREDGWRYELVRGVLVRRPLASALAGVTAARLGARLGAFVDEHGMGVVGTSAGFVLESAPDTVRAPSVWLVGAHRIPTAGIADGYWPGAPGLAVDVLSSWDSFVDVLERVEDFARAGTRLMWVIDPRGRSAAVFRPAAAPILLREDGELNGGDVLPGFRLTLRDVFP
jgi:Uma2 family endonuclease